MSTKFIAACIQNNATPDVDFNIATTLRLAKEAADAGADLICTPEYFSGLRTENGLFHPAAFAEAEHPVLPAFARAARDWKVWFLLGSLGVLNRDGRISNRSYVIDSDGSIVARYNKIHMFDVVLDSGPLTESATIAPGGRSVVAQTPWGGLGLSICYDLRFAPLYRQLAHNGATVLAAPAAFTKVTGEAHWHVLNRARAIEHGCYMISPCQYGESRRRRRLLRPFPDRRSLGRGAGRRRRRRGHRDGRDQPGAGRGSAAQDTGAGPRPADNAGSAAGRHRRGVSAGACMTCSSEGCGLY